MRRVEGSGEFLLHTTGRAHAIANRENQIQVVLDQFTFYLALPLDLNCQGFLDSCLFEQLTIFKYVLGVQGIGKVKWMTQGAGSGIMYQALKQGGQPLDMKGHWLYLAAPTTSAPALEQLAVDLGFTTDRDNKYYDSLNPDQLIGSGRLQGGNILTAWRRLRSGRDTEYTPLKFGVDAGKEALMMNSTFNSVSAVQKALVVAGAATGLASGATAIAGLGIALLGVGGIAFHSFFPEEYHNSKDKF